MIQKSSRLVCCDKNGVNLTGVFHLYGGFYKKYTTFGTFIKISVKLVSSIVLNLKKNKFKAFFVLSKTNQTKKDGSFLFFKINNCVLLKRRLTPLGKELIGPCNYNIFRKRFASSFSKCL